ncbi:hypothetical protein PsorP6_004768 [Peronosclerospora sorghi]|uniref:Uncharacterized protein n=1 Tax=Peronosclerospora sorghi TaxID=230839 RepID=A0ACC0VMS9_9STRA|nr:hypothetical protein PsorP6_004768 [Peronosclerospora sorghi]
MPHLMRTTIGSVPVVSLAQRSILMFSTLKLEMWNSLSSCHSSNHDNIIVVNDGLVSEVELKDQRPHDMYKMRFVQRKKKRRMGILNGFH